MSASSRPFASQYSWSESGWTACGIGWFGDIRSDMTFSGPWILSSRVWRSRAWSHCWNHVFPGRYRIKEGHTFVPFGSVLRARWWLRLWAMLGVRNSFQHGLSAKEVARRNREFLTAQTRYLRRREIRRCAPRVEFVELRHLEMVRPWPHWVLRPLAPVYSALRTRMILTRTP
jgi:hypothetical protein